MPGSLGYAKLALLLTVLLTEGPKGGHAGEARQRQNARWEMKRHGKPKEPPTPPIMHHVPFAKRCSVLKALARTQLGRGATTGLSAFDPELIPVDTGKKVVFICAQGARSEQVGQYVVAQGILTKAYNMADGLIAWAEAGLPLETGPFLS